MVSKEKLMNKIVINKVIRKKEWVWNYRLYNRTLRSNNIRKVDIKSLYVNFTFQNVPYLYFAKTYNFERMAHFDSGVLMGHMKPTPKSRTFDEESIKKINYCPITGKEFKYLPLDTHKIDVRPHYYYKKEEFDGPYDEYICNGFLVKNADGEGFFMDDDFFETLLKKHGYDWIGF